MNTNWKQKSISGIAILALLATPVSPTHAAAAEEDWANMSDSEFEAKMNENCADVLQRVEAGEKTDQDSKASYCVKAEIARKGINWEKKKAFLIFAAAGTAVTFFGIERLGKRQRFKGMKAQIEAKRTLLILENNLKAAELSCASGGAMVVVAPASSVWSFSSQNNSNIKAPEITNIKLEEDEIIPPSVVPATPLCPNVALLQSQILKEKDKLAKGKALYEKGIQNIVRAQRTCPKLAVATAASGFLFDKYGKYQMNDVKQKYGQSAENPLDLGTIISIGGLGIAAAGMVKDNKQSLFMKKEDVMKEVSGMQEADSCTIDGYCNGSDPKLANEKNFDTSDFDNDASNKKSHCFKIAAGLGVWGGITWNSKKGLESEARNNVKTAAKIKIEQGGANRVSVASVQDNKATSKKPSSPGTSGSTSDPCSKSKDYLNCAVKQSPEIAAITNHPGFMQTMRDELGGKNLGELLRNSKAGSVSELSQSVGSAIGANPSALAAAITENTKNAPKAAEFLNGGMGSMQFASYGSGSALSMPRLGGRGGADTDFSKLLNGLMPGMNDGKGEGDGEPTAAADEVYRRMDLMPADTIQSNKDISLFLRVAYRYRKKSDALDPTLKTEPNREIGSEKK
jgi:hypothetical protein